jgi:peptidoglycan/LPS O-acetylase OafA/YrhL
MRWSGDGIGHRFETVADAIAIGCLLAGIRPWLHRSSAYLRMLGSPGFVAVPLLVIAANLLHDHPVVYFTAALFIVNIGVAACVDWCVTFSEGRVGRMLNATSVVFVGTMSYSLYLWQQIFLNRSSANSISTFPLNLVLAVTAAVASYYLVERPSLRLRRRLEKRVPAAGLEVDRVEGQGVAIHGMRASSPLISAPSGSPSVDFSPPR